MSDNSDIIHAVYSKDHSAIRSKIRTPLQANIKCDGVPLTHIAIHSQDRTTLRVLLEAGADLNTTDDLGQTALTLAASCNTTTGHKILEDMLMHNISSEASINSTINRNAADIAARCGNYEGLRILARKWYRSNRSA
jgi:ankyrin repeat protein